MQQKIGVLASPEEALIISKQVDCGAMIDAITAINDRTEAICDLLIQGLQCKSITSGVMCSIAWQIQGNMDCLMLFVKQFIKNQRLCMDLIAVARKKTTDIIMLHSISDISIQSFDEAVDNFLTIKKYIKAVAAMAIYQEPQMLI